MKSCNNCTANIDENYIICPYCYTVLIPDLVPEKKPRKRITPKWLKKLIIVISYIIFLILLISWMIVSGFCFRSYNNKCYNLTLVLMILCWIFCCIAPVLAGEELPKWKI